ncbi:MAG: response regulator [Elusimicrobia bacterium]|nr:response regulator [Elusimicrobiota bacterium]
MKVLIVDDNPESLYLLNTLLTRSGYTTVSAEDGVEALGKLKKKKIDIIISDILMPKMDGFQLCRACKKDDKLKKIPFLFYTATYRRKQDEEFGLSLGAEKFIIKPQEPDVLLKILGDFVMEHKKKKPKRSLIEPISEDLYLAEHKRRIIKKLGDKIISLDKEIAIRKKTEDELYIRIKELNYLYSMVNLMIKPSIQMEKIFEETVKHISDGMQDPELTCSRIIFNKKEYKTKNFKETKWKSYQDILVRGKKKGVVEVYYLKKRLKNSKDQFFKEEKKIIDGVSKITSAYIERKLTEEELRESYQKIKTTLSGAIKTLANIVEVRDPYTSGHQKRVAMLATAIAEKLGLDKDEIEAINTTALIHDVGKIQVPTSILSKPGKLSDVEFKMVKIHSRVGYDILKDIEFPYPVAKIVAQHHERLDGSGYPEGLRSKDITMEAKIIAVADAMEAMISHRPYRPALGIDKAIEEITREKGKLYDSKIVDICITLLKKKSFRDNLGKE